MGLIVDIFRNDYRSDLCVLAGVRQVTLVNVDGPFDPAPGRPAAMLTRRSGNLVVVPVGDDGVPAMLIEVAFGGSYAASSDSRFHKAVGFYGAVPIHDYAIGLESPGDWD